MDQPEFQPLDFGSMEPPAYVPPTPDRKVAGAAHIEGPATGTALLEPIGPRDELGHGDPRAARPAKTRPAGFKIAVAAVAAVVVVGGGAVAALALSGDSGTPDKAVARPGPVADNEDPQQQPDPKLLAAQRERDSMDRAAKAAKDAAGKPPALQPKGIAPTEDKKKDDKGGDGDGNGGGGNNPPQAGNPTPVGEAQRIAKGLLPSYGFSPSSQFGCLVNLWNRESHWNTHAGNPTSGAYGIPQSLPGEKMASAGPDWRNNPRTQIKWGLGYIKGRYGTPCGAWAHFQSHNWY